MINITESIGQQVTVTLLDGSTFVGRLDSVDRSVIVISGVIIGQASITSVEDEPSDEPGAGLGGSEYHERCGHFHGEWDACSIVGSPCGDYRCCVN